MSAVNVLPLPLADVWGQGYNFSLRHLLLYAMQVLHIAVLHKYSTVSHYPSEC
jgi:hypothetical protein